MGALLLTTAFTSCTYENFCIKASNDVATEEFHLESIEAVDLQIAGTVTLRQGPQAVKVTGDPSVIAALDQKTEDGMWNIRFGETCYRNYDLHVEVTVPDLSKVILSGSGAIEVMDFAGQDDLELLVAGSGDIYLNSFEADRIHSMINGSGNIVAYKAIQLEESNVSIYGSGEFKGFDLQAVNSSVRISGSGNTFVKASTVLDVNIDGSGNVYYKGDPAISFSITGSGEVIKS